MLSQHCYICLEKAGENILRCTVVWNKVNLLVSAKQPFEFMSWAELGAFT